MLRIFIIILVPSIAISQSVDKGIQYYEAGKLKAAKSIFEEIDDDHTEYHKAVYYLGRIAFDEQEYDDAADYFEDAIEERDNVSDYHLWYGNAMGVEAQNANIIRQGFLAPKIKSAFERAVELDNSNIDALWGLVQYYIQAPSIMGGSYEKAEEMAVLISKVDKEQGHVAYANIYTSQEKLDKVEQHYKAAAAIDPKYYFNLGYLYQSQQRYDKAFEVFGRLANNKTHKMNALYQIGRTSAFSGERTDQGIRALIDFLQVEESDKTPSHAAAHMRLGMIYEKSGKKPEALKYYNMALAKDPDLEEARKGRERLD